jgi:hypothetical protein
LSNDGSVFARRELSDFGAVRVLTGFRAEPTTVNFGFVTVLAPVALELDATSAISAVNATAPEIPSRFRRPFAGGTLLDVI